MYANPEREIRTGRTLKKRSLDLKNERVKLLAITEKGTGQVIDINSDGLSFGCLYNHSFPDELSVDILDASGTFIQKVKVRKTWEQSKDLSYHLSQFVLIIGVEFVGLTPGQERGLLRLLRRMGNLENNTPFNSFRYIQTPRFPYINA